MEVIKDIPHILFDFILVTVFSLIIGLSQRRLHNLPDHLSHTFGTDRTFTFIGILGFILYILNPSGVYLFAGGGVVITAYLAIHYYFNILKYEDHGLTTILIALITYCIGPLLLTQPRWLVMLIIVTVLILTEMKESFLQISQKFNKDEFLTLGKFLIIAGVILPIVPDEPIFKGLDLTPYKIWLAVVVVSTISYISYLLRKFVFPKASIILSGVLGGLYSSTATTIILARKCKEENNSRNQYIAAILFATAMMYLRILVLILIFNSGIFLRVYPYFIILFFATLLVGTGVLFFRNKKIQSEETGPGNDKNPLEFKVALVFTALYIVFSFLTFYVITYYGTTGLHALSYIVGLSDIDPFLINLFQGKFTVTATTVAVSTFQAMFSNNLLKMVYACFFTRRKDWLMIIISFMIILVINFIFVWLV
ncbi:MAG: DUF4010 domain-containing protein [Bacteroidota bacterium]|nr:DUF4010 domain-containing protein [Bacteroidota bacterium]